MNNRYHQILIGIVCLAVLLRIGAAFYMGDTVVDLPGTADQISYHNLALRVLGGHGFTFGEDWWPATAANAPTAHWSFLYTFYLVLVYALFGVHPLAARIIQAILVGILQPWLAYLIGEKVFNRKVGLASGAITALYAYFIYYAGSLMTESFYIIAVMGSLYLAMLVAKEAVASNSLRTPIRRLPWLGAGLGLSLGTAVLLRQLYLLFIPFLFAWVWWARKKATRQSATPNLVMAGIVIMAMIIPFTVYNTARFGHFVLLNTNAGFAFFWGNNPVYGTHFVPLLPDYHALIPKDLLSLDEAALDQALLIRGFQFVINDPARFILLSLSRVPVFFMFGPSADSGLISNLARMTSFGIFWPFMLYGLILSFSSRFSTQRQKPYYLALLIIFIIIYSAIHLLSWALIRYRLPVDAVLIIFAGLAILELTEKVSSWWIRNRNKPIEHDVKAHSLDL